MKKTTKVAKQKRVAQPDGDTEFRVVRLPLAIRSAVAESRKSGDSNNEGVIGSAVAASLPGILDALRGVGAESLVAPSKSYRLPFSRDTLLALKDGSETVGIPAAHLLVLCLSSLVRKPARKGGKAGR